MDRAEGHPAFRGSRPPRLIPRKRARWGASLIHRQLAADGAGRRPPGRDDRHQHDPVAATSSHDRGRCPVIAIDSVRLPGEFHADPADRLIVATVRHRRVPLVTADQAILACAAEGHVQVIDAAR